MSLASSARAVARSTLPSSLYGKLRPLRAYWQEKIIVPTFYISALRQKAEFGHISFGPRMPLPGTAVLPKICEELGWAVQPYSPARQTRLTIFWPRSEDSFPPQPSHWINAKCTNIDKTRVAEASQRVFGASYLVDPTTHSGPMVRKSDRNAAHDGIVVNGPQPREAGYVYMQYIDNVRGNEVQDIRVIYMRGLLLFAYLKWRSIPDRFRNVNTRVEMVSTTDVMSASEMAGVEAMCRDIGMDYGEIDCLRDRSTGMLYAIDVNRTPWGPPIGLTEADSKSAVGIMAKAFSAAFP